MVDAKDTFYVALRDRLVTVNPGRTMMVRGALRPGILVEDAEPVARELPRDVFVLRWTDVGEEQSLPPSMAMMGCDIHYGTVGTEAACGLDRGRALSAMDVELREILKPTSTAGMDYTAIPAAATGAIVFWTEAVFGSVTTTRDCLERVAKVTVLARQAEGVQ